MKDMNKKSVIVRSVGPILALLSFASSAVPSYASSSTSGSLSGIVVIRSGKLFFNQSGTRNTRPTCSSIDRWVIDVSTTSGQAEAAVVLTAFAQNRLVHITGTGACADWADTESVDALYIDN